MAHKQANLSKGKLFFVLLATGIVFLLLPQGITANLNFLFARVSAPLLSIGRSPRPDLFVLPHSSADSVQRSEYNKLYTAYKNAQADLLTLQKNYEKLACVRSSLPNPGPGLVLASITNFSINPLRRELFINRGENHGIKTGQYVLGQNCIIGRISKTSAMTAAISLVTDSNHRIKVWIWRKGTKYISGQMTGNGTDFAGIPLISSQYDVKSGDSVYAAVVPGLLDTPRIIGTVSEVKRDRKKPMVWDITVTPVYNIKEMNDVAVIVTEPVK